MTVDQKFQLLREKLGRQRRLLVMFSGGLDSALLVSLAREVLGDDAAAITIDSGIISAQDRRQAVERAAILGIEQTMIPVHELADPAFRENDPRRCYHCRKIRNRAVRNWASEHGYPVIAEGMNVSDLSDYRPGMEASDEDGIWKPFIECGIDKDDIKAYSKKKGLPWWGAPSTVCLCSRIPHNTPLHINDLQRVEKAEDFIQGLGFSPVRVRSLPGGIALIEVSDPAGLIKQSSKIVPYCKEIGFVIVSLDMEGFVSGKLNRTLSNAVR